MKSRRRPKKYLFGLSITDRAELVRVVNVKRQRRKGTGRFIKKSKPSTRHFTRIRTIKATENNTSEIQEPSKTEERIIINGPSKNHPISRSALPKREREVSPSHQRARPVSGRTLKNSNKSYTSQKNWDKSTLSEDINICDRNRKAHERKVRRILKRRERRPVNGIIIPNDKRFKDELEEFRKCEYIPAKECARTVDIHLRTETRSRHHKLRTRHVLPPSPRSLGRRR